MPNTHAVPKPVPDCLDGLPCPFADPLALGTACDVSCAQGTFALLLGEALGIKGLDGPQTGRRGDSRTTDDASRRASGR